MAGRSSVNLTDVARRAGVSLATASRAVNDAYGVSPETRSRVLAAADALDFVASPEASRLARGVTGRVALVVPHLERWFFGQMVAGMERVLSEAGLDILLYHVDDEADRRSFLKHLPARRKVDAVVVVAFPVDEEDQRRLELIGAKIVAAGGQSATYPFVCIDDFEAGRLAIEHLCGLGHRRIAMIAGEDPDQPGWPSVPGRSRAYEETLARHGVAFDRSLVREVEWSAANAARAMDDLLDSSDSPPTAVYVHSDELALGVLHSLQHRGLRVPQDMSVIGIDDHPIAEMLDLSTIRQDVREQGATAAHLVLSELGLSSDVETHSVTAPVELVVRTSTGPAPRMA